MRQAEALHNARRVDPDRLKNSALKTIAGHIARLSYRDMQQLASVFDAKNDPDRTTAERLLAVADDLLEGASPDGLQHDGRGPG